VATNNSRSSKRSSKSQKSKSSTVAVTTTVSKEQHEKRQQDPSTADQVVICVHPEMNEAREDDNISRSSKNSSTSVTSAPMKELIAPDTAVEEEGANVAQMKEEEAPATATEDKRCSAEPPVSNANNNNDNSIKIDLPLSFSDKVDHAHSNLAGKSCADNNQSTPTLERSLEITYEHFLEFEQLRKEHIRHAHDALEQSTLTEGSFMKVREVKEGDLHIEESSDPAVIVQAEKEEVKKRDDTSVYEEHEDLSALAKPMSFATPSSEAPTSKMESLSDEQSPPTKTAIVIASSEESAWDKVAEARDAEDSSNEPAVTPKATLLDTTQESHEYLLQLREQNNAALVKMKMQVKQIQESMDKRKRESVRISKTAEKRMKKNLVVLVDALEKQEKIEKEFAEKQEKHMKTEWKPTAFGSGTPLKDPTSGDLALISPPSMQTEVMPWTSVAASALGETVTKDEELAERHSVSSPPGNDGEIESENGFANTGATAYPVTVIESENVQTAWNELIETAQDLRFTFSEGKTDNKTDDDTEDSVSVASDKTGTSFGKFKSYLLQRKRSKLSDHRGGSFVEVEDNTSVSSNTAGNSFSKSKNCLVQREKCTVSKETPSPSSSTKNTATLPTGTGGAGDQNKQNSQNLLPPPQRDGTPDLATLIKEAWSEVSGCAESFSKTIFCDVKRTKQDLQNALLLD